jgi:hypothetical protein
MFSARVCLFIASLLVLGTAVASAQTPAADVQAGTFGSNVGGGNYAFPANLTVDTNTLFVNAASNRVGIGTNSPAATLSVFGSAYFNLSNAVLTGSSVVIQTGLSVQRPGGGTSAPNIEFTGYRGTDSAPTASGSGDETGRFLFRGFDGVGTVSSARFGAIVDGAVSSSTVPQAIIFRTGTSNSPVERLRISSNGNVGVGATAPADKRFYVAGDAHVTGTLTGANIAATYQDLAEWVPATESLEAGTVVVLNPERSNEVIASATSYDTTVAGVVSEQPGIILGIPGDSKEMIATTGRVRVRVDATSSPIRIGDLLVTSDVPGTAMKSQPIEVSGRRLHQPGTLIGKALEPLSEGQGTILVLLSLQ